MKYPKLNFITDTILVVAGLFIGSFLLIQSILIHQKGTVFISLPNQVVIYFEMLMSCIIILAAILKLIVIFISGKKN